MYIFLVISRKLRVSKEVYSYTIFDLAQTREWLRSSSTYGGVSPVLYDILKVGRRVEEQIVSPLVETDFQSPIFVHPVNKRNTQINISIK